MLPAAVIQQQMKQLSPLHELLGREFWEAIQAELKNCLEAARQNLHAMRVKYERSPVQAIEKKLFLLLN
jgi:hypothetical protein